MHATPLVCSMRQDRVERGGSSGHATKGYIRWLAYESGHASPRLRWIGYDDMYTPFVVF